MFNVVAAVLIVNIVGNWRVHQKDVPPSLTVLGTVHVNGLDGALVRDLNSGQFFLMTNGRLRALDQAAVICAWRAALTRATTV